MRTRSPQEAALAVVAVRWLLSSRCNSFRVGGHSPTFSQRRTAAPFPPAVQRWAEWRNPFRIELAPTFSQRRTAPLSPGRSNAGLSEAILSGLGIRPLRDGVYPNPVCRAASCPLPCALFVTWKTWHGQRKKGIPLGPRNAWRWHWPRNWGLLASSRLWPGGAGRAGGPGESGQVQAGGGDEDSLAPGGGFGGGAVRPRTHRWVASGGAGPSLLSRGGMNRLSPAAPPPSLSLLVTPFFWN